MKVLTDDLKHAVEILRAENIDASDGLQEELFLLVSSLVQLPNVDLLIVNGTGQILLSRRNDEFFEKSWHIPGGCMRYGEEFADRIQQTALREIGCEVRFDSTPVAVRSVIRGANPKQAHPYERGHTVAVLFRCFLPDGYEIDNGEKKETDNGYLKWFDKLPCDFMKIQNLYKDVLGEWL